MDLENSFLFAPSVLATDIVYPGEWLLDRSQQDKWHWFLALGRWFQSKPQLSVSMSYHVMDHNL